MKEWHAFLEKQKDRLGHDAIERWVKNLKIAEFDAANLYLEASDPFQVHWFEQYLRPLALTGFKTANGRLIKVHLSLIGTKASTLKKTWKPTLDLSSDLIFPTANFSTFFPGNTNEIHFEIFKDNVDKNQFNPMYLHGPKETGKTHLLMAACHELKKKQIPYFYVKANKFTEHVVAAIRCGMMPVLREHYRKHAALIIDDIDTLADRNASQEELFHTFNALHLAGKQIIIAGRQPAFLLKGIEPRLTSRFEWGLSLSLSPLSEEDLELYLRKQLTAKGIPLEEEVITFCLSHFSSFPFLQRAIDLIKLHFRGQKLCNAFLEQWLHPLLQELRQNELTPTAIIKKVAVAFDVNSADIEGKGQTQDLAFARQVSMYLCRQLLNIPYTQIAKIFSRNHSTVMSSIKLIEEKMNQQEVVKNQISQLTESLTLSE